MESLQKAAEISTMEILSPRTLGPDKPQWRPQQQQLHSEVPTNENREKKDSPKVKMIKMKTPNQRPSTPPFLFQNNLPDIDALNSSIIKCKVREECKRNVNMQLNKLEQRQLAINKQIVQQKNEQAADHRKRLLENQQTMETILKRAEQETKEALQQQQKQLEQIRAQTKKKLQQITFQGIAKYQMRFRTKYETIAKLLISLDKDAQQACNEHYQKLREQVPLFDQMIATIKEGNFGPEELKTAENLCATLETIENCIVKELTQYATKLQQQELDKAKTAAEEAKNKAVAAAQAAAQQEEEEATKQRQLKEQNDLELLKQEQMQQQQFLQQQQYQQQQQQQQIASNANDMETMNQTPPQQEQQQQQQTPQITDTSAVTLNRYLDPNTSKEFADANRALFFNQINELYQNKVESVKPLQTDENWRKYRTYCHKAINIPLNAISAVSSQHLLDKFEKLYSFIIGHPYKTPEGQISVNDHPLARDYCILWMAKKFVSQAETAISSNPQAAFPFASVIVQLWKLVPDFGPILLAYIFKESHYMVPCFIHPVPGQSTADILKLLGYRVDNNVLEQPDMYLKRQAGLARLYGAIMVSNGRQADTNPHPYGMAEAWRWITHFVSLYPMPDISATLLLEMLQIVGSEMWRFYGIQFSKLLMYIQQYYFPSLNAIDVGGPKTRLELLLGKFIREGKIPQATGVLPPGFW